MRFRPAIAIAVVVLFTAMIPTPALAGMPLPCTGDRSIKVNESGIKLKNGTTVFLGYMYQGGSVRPKCRSAGLGAHRFELSPAKSRP